MVLNKITKLISKLHLLDIPRERRDNAINCAPFVLASDSIGLHLLEEYSRALKYRRLNMLFWGLYSQYYFFFLILAPMFFVAGKSNTLYDISVLLTFGLSEYLEVLEWYWEILCHLITITISLIIGMSLSSQIPSEFKTRKSLQECIKDLDKRGELTREKVSQVQQTTTSSNSERKVNKKSNSAYNPNIEMNSVFIVHGHDEHMKSETARFLEKLDLQTLILHEKSSLGKTIIEKIEYYSDVSFAVVLLSPDDLGCSNSKTSNMTPRARQNVIFEHGYLIAKLGRQRVCALVKGKIETPSDVDGIVYVPYDDAGAWKLEIAKEMKAVGLSINSDKLL